MVSFIRELRWTSNELLDDLIAYAANPHLETEIWYSWYKFMNCILYHPWYALVRGIRNMWYWIGYIWSNDVFDHRHLHDMIDKQLVLMEKFWKGPNPYAMKKNQIAKRIAWTRRLYQLHMDEYYSMKHFMENNDGWEDFPNNTCKNTMTDEEFAIHKVETNKAYEMDEKVWKLYIKNLERSREWWD